MLGFCGKLVLFRDRKESSKGDNEMLSSTEAGTTHLPLENNFS